MADATPPKKKSTNINKHLLKVTPMHILAFRHRGWGCIIAFCKVRNAEIMLSHGGMGDLKKTLLQNSTSPAQLVSRRQGKYRQWLRQLNQWMSR